MNYESVIKRYVDDRWSQLLIWRFEDAIKYRKFYVESEYQSKIDYAWFLGATGTIQGIILVLRGLEHITEEGYDTIQTCISEIAQETEFAQ